MNYTKEHIFNLLKDYSDTKKQHFEWTENLTKTYFTPTELIEEWFSDTFTLGPEDIIGRGELNEEEWAIIKPFYEVFRMFADHFGKREDEIPVDMTEYEPWKIVSAKASQTLHQLQKIGWKVE